MILRDPQPLRVPSARARWALPFTYPAQFIPRFDLYTPWMVSDEIRAQMEDPPGPKELFEEIMVVMAMEKVWQERSSKGEEFTQDDPAVYECLLKPEIGMQMLANAYISWMMTARDLVNMRAHCVHVTSDYASAIELPESISSAKDNIIVHVEGMTFSDGTPIAGVHMRWWHDNPADQHLEMAFVSNPGRWLDETMKTVVVAGHFNHLAHNPVACLEGYNKFTRETMGTSQEMLAFSEEEIGFLASRFPTLIAIFAKMEERNSMMVDITMPEPFNRPSFGEHLGKNEIPVAEYASRLARPKDLKRYGVSEHTRPIWLLG